MSQPDFAPEYEFDADLELASEDGGGVFVAVPFNVQEVYGTRGQVPIRATIDGFPYQGVLSPMGDGQHVLIIIKTVRGAIGKTWGDTVHVKLARDTAPRTVEVPDDFVAAMAAVPGLREKFEALAYTHRREYVQWIERAKKYETRQRRLEEAVALIQAGKKR